MNICIPVDADRGVASPVCAHFEAQHPTVELTLAAFKAGRLRAMRPEAACGHHGQ